MNRHPAGRTFRHSQHLTRSERIVRAAIAAYLIAVAVGLAFAFWAAVAYFTAN